MHHVLLVRSSYSLKARQAELQALQSSFPVKRYMMYSMDVLCSVHPGLCMRAVLRMPTASPGLPDALFCWHLSANKHIDGNGLPAPLAPITATLLTWDTVRLTSMIAGFVVVG